MVPSRQGGQSITNVAEIVVQFEDLAKGLFGVFGVVVGFVGPAQPVLELFGEAVVGDFVACGGFGEGSDGLGVEFFLEKTATEEEVGLGSDLGVGAGGLELGDGVVVFSGLEESDGEFVFEAVVGGVGFDAVGIELDFEFEQVVLSFLDAVGVVLFFGFSDDAFELADADVFGGGFEGVVAVGFVFFDEELDGFLFVFWVVPATEELDEFSDFGGVVGVLVDL